jgi:hypothetical protein
MPTPKELAQIVEQYDQEQWFDFLDELDAVSRRRRGRDPEPDEPASNDRDSVAGWIARRHLLADRSIQEIWYMGQGAPPDEIRLLEVSDRLSSPDARGSAVHPMEFGLGRTEGPFRLLVADVTSDEVEDIKAGRLALPPGWQPGGVRIGRRQA